MNVNAAESDLWVITAYFNLAGWSSRLENYRAFCRALGSPVATIEWSPSGLFELGDADADLLIRLRGGDLMWQKERLLGIALSALPEHVRYVVWVDCDVIFADRQWHARTRRLLQDYLVVQPFRRALYLSPGATRRVLQGGASAEVLRAAANGRRSADGSGGHEGPTSRPSFLDVFERVHEDIARVDLQRRFEPEPTDAAARPARGLAWAARVDAIRQIGFYERCVLGGGDTIFAYALVGHHEEVVANHRLRGWDSYGGGARCRKWADQAAELCCGRLKCGEETIFHLYHGSLENRQHRARIDRFVRFGVDIERDIAADPGVPWSWTRDASRLNSYFLEYLRNRKEDS